MAGKDKKKQAKETADGIKTIARNRRARFDYFIEETIEAGIMLTGTEVKSLRNGQASLNESHAHVKGGEVWLLGAHIAEYPQAHAKLQHEPTRPRKLLLHKSQMNRLIGAVQRKGVTLIPESIYFNKRGIAKIALGIATGKKQHDKRATEKDRDWQREKGRVMREKG